MWGRRRNFAAIAAVDAERYELAADAELAAKAEIVVELGPRARAEMAP